MANTGELTRLSGAWIVPLVLLAIAVIALFFHILEKKRRDALRALAQRRGLCFYAHDPFGLPAAYGDSRLCSQGHSKRASNVMAGPVADGEVRYFDYRYTVGSGKNSHTYSKSACAFNAPYRFTRLLVRPENFLDKAAGFLGFDDIDLDYAEFNSKFHVSCEDKKFAYDVLHQRAMEFFVERPGITMEMGWNYLLFNYDGRLSPDQVDALISTAATFYEALPNFLMEQRKIAQTTLSNTAGLTGNLLTPGQAGVKGIEPTRRPRQDARG